MRGGSAPKGATLSESGKKVERGMAWGEVLISLLYTVGLRCREGDKKGAWKKRGTGSARRQHEMKTEEKKKTLLTKSSSGGGEGVGLAILHNSL